MEHEFHMVESQFSNLGAKLSNFSGTVFKFSYVLVVSIYLFVCPSDLQSWLPPLVHKEYNSLGGGGCRILYMIPLPYLMLHVVQQLKCG